MSPDSEKSPVKLGPPPPDSLTRWLLTAAAITGIAGACFVGYDSAQRASAMRPPSNTPETAPAVTQPKEVLPPAYNPAEMTRRTLSAPTPPR